MGIDIEQSNENVSLFLDPDLEDFESGPRLRGALLECSGNRIKGWMVDGRSVQSALAISLFVGSHSIAETRTGRSAASGKKSPEIVRRFGFQFDLSTTAVRQRLARALRSALSDSGKVDVSLRVDLYDGENYRLPLFEGSSNEETITALGFSEEARHDLLSSNGADIIALADGRVRFVCFYLPQFHPLAENDRWWGPGFSEWTNVARMRPQFPSHQSPWLPADLGFYDIRLKETRQQQAELARLYGVHGFCYYVYWFQGRRLLQKPLELMLEDGEPNLPFCICWANENWSRRWDGSDAELLLGQNHSLSDDVRFIDDMADLLLDDRYITVDGRKILIIYRPSLIPEKESLFKFWRLRARELGIGELLICNAMTFGEFDSRDFNCDAAVEFPPHTVSTRELSPAEVEVPATFTGKLYDYIDAMRSALGKAYDFPFFPGVMPRWDNTPRKGARGHAFVRSSPEAFEMWLREASDRSKTSGFSEPIVFINSWNEWAEGAHLEPDSIYGRAYLDVVRRVATQEPISAQLRADPTMMDCLSRLELERTLRETAMQIEVLAKIRRLEISHPGFQTVRTGMPTEMELADRNPVGSMLVIESVNSVASERTVVDPRYSVLVRGWVFAGESVRAGKSRIGFLVLQSKATDSSDGGYCMVVDWYDRRDVKEYVSAAGDECCFGFQVAFSVQNTPDGEYGISVLEVGDGRNALIDSNCSLVIRR